MTDLIVVTGAGGVGKTTLSAAIAIADSSADRRTLVMTVDPAKRLADALDLGNLEVSALTPPPERIPGRLETCFSPTPTNSVFS